MWAMWRDTEKFKSQGGTKGYVVHKGVPKTQIPIDILLCETHNTSDLTSGDFVQGSFSNKIAI